MPIYIGEDTSASNPLNRANHTGTQAISTVTGLQDALDNAGGSSVASATVTIPNGRGKREYYATVVDATVSPTDKINIYLADALDSDENSPEMLDVQSISAKAGTGSFAVVLCFYQPTSGPIKLNYSKG